MEKTFQMVAKTFQGLEDVLCDELINLGAQNVEIGLRMVSFEGNLETMYKANMCCRTALRILKPIVKFTADSPDELYDHVRDLDWEEYLGPDSTFAIDSTVNSAEFTHSRFVTYRVKDGIVDHFNDKYGRRPSIRLSGADVLLNVHISDNRVTISLDSSGEPLSKRGYRTEHTDAPINEVLAAGIIMKTGWRGECDFADPMCGSGTFLIEAALIASNINPGVYRENFAFEKWPDFDKELFEEIYNDDSDERDFAYRIYGGDIDPEAVAIARRNIRNAHVEDMIELSCRPFTDWIDNPAEGVMVTNPPYGERLRPDDMSALYRSIGTTLKNSFKGWHAWILGYRDEHFADIGLKPSVKIPLLNGSLECSLREYVLFDGSYSTFREEGGSIGNTAYSKEKGPKKVKHISDDEWERQARGFSGQKNGRKERHKDKAKDFQRHDKRNFNSYPSSDDIDAPAPGTRPEFKRRDDDRRDFRRDDRGPRPDFKRRDDDRRDFRRDDRGPRPDFKRRDDDRRDFRRDDRGPRPEFKRRDYDRRDFRRDDRGPRPDFKRRDDDRRDFRRDDRGPRPDFKRRDDDRRDFRRDSDYRSNAYRPAREVKPQGPRLPESSSTQITSGPYMRQRKGWKRPEEEAGDTND